MCLCHGLIAVPGKRATVRQREGMCCDAENFFVVESGFSGVEDTKRRPPERHAEQIHSGAGVQQANVSVMVLDRIDYFPERFLVVLVPVFIRCCPFLVSQFLSVL